MPNGQMISQENGWKVVVALLTILSGLVALVWGSHVTYAAKALDDHTRKIEAINARDSEIERSITEIKAHLVHYEVTQQEIKEDVKKILEKID